MVSPPKPYYTPEEYLALERAAPYKSEYLAGEIFAMAGAREEHNTIAANIVRQLGNQFQGRPCRVYVSDMRVRVSPAGLYTYPDVVAVCGPREFADAHHDTLINPTVIFEILSPSTEAYDRGEKFAQYWRLASLTDYVLVAQDRVRVEHFTRQGDGWFVTAASALDDALRLASIDAVLPLAALYENLEFPPSAAEPPV
ncbi:MAG TPA: Uma2 family endonuclease [Chloroflexia bacterium]|jgi:Uma2 family endonuclease|nr:Uma2 family endonuclease [Chloroflexia bacterium]